MEKITINQQLGKRIIYLRKQMKWSQEELSFFSGINKNYLCDMENGRRNPTLRILSAISTAFNISLQTLFKGIETVDDLID